MTGPPFLVSSLVNKESFARTLIDTGCLAYAVIDSRFAQKYKLKRVNIPPRTIKGYADDDPGYVVDELAIARIDIDGHVEKDMFFYIVPKLASYDVILGNPWFKLQKCRYKGGDSHIRVGTTRTKIWDRSKKSAPTLDCTMISATSFALIAKKSSRKSTKRKVEVFSASMADIEKALSKKVNTDPRLKLPKHYHSFLDLTSRTEADRLPPLRGKGVDHKIEIEEKDGKLQEVPWGALYNMSRDELLVLRKTLTELLDKNFIRVSNSPAAAPVLFVRKPGGGLRFCVDYRGLNKITRKDRYPLPLVYETLRNVGRAKWYSKLDVIAAFHRIRIAEGDEWKTAFRTRYGLYEWMVTPFGLANAPSTFQKYINWALRDYLDEFCSAYIDDVLIYTDGSLEEHRKHVRQVMERLRVAGLQIDIDKCEFEVKTTKYLGFILEVGKGVRMDPEKIRAILEWESPRSVKGVQSFLGFANFYRRFIHNFSDLTLEMTALVRKDQVFEWTEAAEKQFQELKRKFTIAPILVQFDYDRTTVLETDSSGYCIGGVLLQLVDDIWRPVAFYSKKNSPAECNYEIYDKEMLAIIRCLEEWDAELRSVPKFQIRTDHKNLEYFMTARKLTERQMRWSLILSKFNFTITYVPGPQNERADALSRREQDIPSTNEDERIQHRTTVLLKPETLQPLEVSPLTLRRINSPYQARKIPSSLPPSTLHFPLITQEKKEEPSSSNGITPENLAKLWNTTKVEDSLYNKMTEAVLKKRTKFPTPVVSGGIKFSISECSLDEEGRLQFRGRLYVPEDEKLRTSLIQETHDSVISGHPGREVTNALLSRQFFWQNMSKDVRQFCRNCDTCRAKTAWRQRKQGFLKPLPIPDRLWREISVDYIVDLPESNGCTNIMVITDRLGKGVIFEPCSDITAETLTEAFVRRFYSEHGLPAAIVSDRGSQFVSILWARVCQDLGIVRRISTAYHPQTDGATERANQDLEAYLRTFCNHEQDNWKQLLPLAQLAINNHDSSTTGVSPFFLSHGYHIEPIQLPDDLQTVYPERSPIQIADNIVYKLYQALEWAKVSMAAAQQNQEKAANRTRQQAPDFRIGDKVWLSTKNIRTTRRSKKLDAKYIKYTITGKVSTHAYRLDTPPGIHNVFHVDKLLSAASDPLPSQRTTDYQPLAKIVGEDQSEEYEIEKILDEKGKKGHLKYLVKWTGYQQPTWEPARALQETIALDLYEKQKQPKGNKKPRRSIRGRRNY